MLVKRKPTNIYNKDKNAVAVYLEDVVVGHVPHNIAGRHDFHDFCYGMLTKEVTGQKINSGAGYGLEVPSCVSRLYGPKVYIQRINELVSSLRRAGLL